MPKIIGMIPVLLGSTRIPDKNLILVNNKILCSYSIDACNKSNAFSKIYLNSENEIFKDIAENEKINFYHRKAESGGTACQQKNKSRVCGGERCVINEHYLYDFMKTVHCDYLFQVNSTSPLLKPDTISKFVKEIIDRDYDCLFSVKRTKAETFMNGNPINFTRNLKRPSQELLPIDIICWAIAGWKCDSFIRAYERDDVGEAAAVFYGNLGLFSVDEREALDIDEWSTLDLVDQYLRLGENIQTEWTYLDGRKIVVQNNDIL